MLYKNTPEEDLRHVMRVRFWLDYVAAAKFLLSRHLRDAGAVYAARREFRRLRPSYLPVRQENMAKTILSPIPEQMPGSLVASFYLKGKKTFSSLKAAMRSAVVVLLALLVLCSGCRGGGNAFASAEPVRINRYDKALLRLIESDNDVAIQGELLCDYPEMMEIAGKGILDMQTPEMTQICDRLMDYYSEPTLLGLYRDAVAKFDSVAGIEQQLGSAFAYLQAYLPSHPVPRIYMHVSGLGRNVLVADDLLSISIDKYMGADYPLYRNFIDDFRREKMQPARVAPDYLAGWLLSEYPFTGKESVLLDRMVYEGKIRYLISQALPDLPPHILMGWTEEAYAWCRRNEAAIWKTIIERKHLYTPDLITTRRYIEDAPATFLADEAPGSLGVWIGLQMVRRYVKETGASPEQLMRETDAQNILTQSKYKPF
jgi:hypothetical protein